MRNKNLKYLYLFLLLLLFLLTAGTIVSSSVYLDFKTLDFFNLTLTFAIITLIAMLVYFKGLPKEPGAQTMHTFTAVAIKFIAELFTALVWFVIAKKTSSDCIILFLFLYLAFSMFLVWVFLNSLKNKPL